MATCWLNSCLQLILTAMDHSISTQSFTSELGEELLQLQHGDQNTSLDPTNIKDIVVTAEDTRIATRLSELSTEIHDQRQLDERTRAIENLRLNLSTGQQCVRDFFLCLTENVICWPDVYSTFGFKITHSTKCCGCGQINKSETTRMYLEIPVPPDNSNLNDYVEDYLNSSCLVGVRCENNCQDFVQAEKRSTLKKSAETEFLVVLTRAIETLDGFKLIKNKTISTDDVFIRYESILFIMSFLQQCIIGMNREIRHGMRPCQ